MAADDVAWQARAAAVLKRNHHGNYTIPSHGLYPHQWNWDSAFIALGWAGIDVERAWAELASLVAMQCDDGMLPHIAFNPAAQGYQPGPNWWGGLQGADGRKVSSITQPPVLAICLRRMLERGLDTQRAAPLLGHILRWHTWLLTTRDPGRANEPVLVHPWESGRDNAVEWDVALSRCPEAAAAFERADTTHVDSSQRPSKEHYGKYFGLLESFADLRWQQTAIAERSPFRMLDPGFSAILAAACADLAYIAALVGEEKVADVSARQSERICAALDARRSGENMAWPVDLVSGEEVRRHSCSLALQLLQPDLDPAMVGHLAEMVSVGSLSSKWGVGSLTRDDPDFDPENYWRGPVWVNITWLVALGLERHGRDDTALTLRGRLLDVVRGGDAPEYVHPVSGAALGAREFSWTAALALDIAAGPYPVASHD